MQMNDAASVRTRNWWPLVGAIVALVVAAASWYGFFVLLTLLMQ
jgi:hypothetical protein